MNLQKPTIYYSQSQVPLFYGNHSFLLIALQTAIFDMGWEPTYQDLKHREVVRPRGHVPARREPTYQDLKLGEAVARPLVEVRWEPTYKDLKRDLDVAAALEPYG